MTRSTPPSPRQQQQYPPHHHTTHGRGHLCPSLSSSSFFSLFALLRLVLALSWVTLLVLLCWRATTTIIPTTTTPSSSLRRNLAEPTPAALTHSFFMAGRGALALRTDKKKTITTHPVRTEAIPWIKCQVCRQFVHSSYDEVGLIRQSKGLPLRSGSGNKYRDIQQQQQQQGLGGNQDNNDDDDDDDTLGDSAANKKTRGQSRSRNDKNSKKRSDEIPANMYSQYVIKEETILGDVVEQVCNPYHRVGWWIRRYDLQLVAHDTQPMLIPLEDNNKDDDAMAGGEPSLAEPLYAKCKSDCATITEACMQVADSDAADALSGKLFRWDASVQQMEKAVCRSECNAYDRQTTRLEKSLQRILGEMQSLQEEEEEDERAKKGEGGDDNDGGGGDKQQRQLQLQRLQNELQHLQQPSIIGAEVPERIEAKEIEVEEMMDNMRRTPESGANQQPRMDVFGRDTIVDMHDAMMYGTQEEAAEFDSKFDDLTPEEFAELQSIFRSEHGLTETELNAEATARAAGQGRKGKYREQYERRQQKQQQRDTKDKPNKKKKKTKSKRADDERAAPGSSSNKMKTDNSDDAITPDGEL